ncbi:dual specificity protein kinase pyk3 isoform X2 [Drosophila busckii]|nr:dual specificity protein kinase pyk3 isoform X2 [Drosophila busckii]
MTRKIFRKVKSKEKSFEADGVMQEQIAGNPCPPLDDIVFSHSTPIKELIAHCCQELPQFRPTLSKLKSMLESLLAEKDYSMDWMDINHYLLMHQVIRPGALKDFTSIDQKIFGVESISCPGSFNAVWRNQIVVIKSEFVSTHKIKILKDVKEHTKLNHPNIVKIFGVAFEKSVRYLITEYPKGITLHSYLHDERQRKYDDKMALIWMGHAAEAISYLHRRKPHPIIYRNLHPENMILCDDYKVLKISDSFSFSDYCFTNQKLSKLVVYAAPEVFDANNFSTKSDIYSFGIIFWEVLTRKRPYDQLLLTLEKLIEHIREGERPAIGDIPFKLINWKPLIKNCWHEDIKKRGSMKKLAHALRDPGMLNLVFDPDRLNSLDIGLRDVVGKGNFSVVHAAKWRDTLVAVKVKQLDYWTYSTTESLWDVYQLLEHENILRIFGYCHDGINVNLLMEYAECGSLHNYLHDEKHLPYTITRAFDWMHQCIKGLLFLYNKEFKPRIKGNLKPHSCLLTNNYHTLKIGGIDFLDEPVTDLITENHPFFYIAPELFQGEEFTEMCDIYSFGIMFWEVMARKQPFYHMQKHEKNMIKSKILHGERPLLQDIKSFELDHIESIITLCWDPVQTMRVCLQEVDSLLSETKLKDEWSDIVYIGNINLGKIVGEGAFGIVYKGNWCEKEVAVKTFKNIKGHMETLSSCVMDFKKEVKQLSRADHINIIQLYGVTFDRDSAYLIMEYAECGSLHNYLYGREQRVYYASTVFNWMTQCSYGITYLHNMKPKPLIHRDLKPHNCLLKDDYVQLKIGDFGTVTEATSAMSSMVGTPAYIAPEVLNGNKYTEQCDIFSFGVMLWETFTRKKPYYHLENPNRLSIIHLSSQGQRPLLSDITFPHFEKIIKLIECCWHQDPLKRPKIQEVDDILSSYINKEALAFFIQDSCAIKSDIKKKDTD